jgi:rhamnosyltransferase
VFAASPEVVVRCKNEMPHVDRTLTALVATGARVLVVDSGSTDGSLESAMRPGVEVIQITPESYVPGRVLNDAMRRTRGDVVAFVNADAVPLDLDAVGKLVARCEEGAAAAFGRQVPRANARSITKADHARAFPDGAHDPKLDRFFSMAASAIRREVWEALHFDERLRFSEDVDWTMRLRALGLTVAYVPEARFEHSHDYDVSAVRKRMRGEGRADASIRRRSRAVVWRDLVRPLAGAIVRDAGAGVLSVDSLRLRWSGERGRFDGLREGARSPRVPPTSAPAPSHARERFTLRGEPEDEALVARTLAATCARIDAVMGERAKATVLVGSFGCGEGVVRLHAGSRRIHGDLDLVVIVRGPREARRARRACEAVSEEISRTEGAVVDVWPVSERELSEPCGRLLWIDAALRGARVIAGDRGVLRRLEGLGARAAAGEEIGRLLANRATGLALSRLAADAGRHDGVAAARHVAKAWLAVGDAILLLLDRYEASSTARLAQLERFAKIEAPVARAVVAGYAWALGTRAATEDASLTPAQLDAEAARIWYAHSAIEAQRLCVPDLATPERYAALSSRIYGDLPDVPAAARLFGGARAAARRLITWRRAGRHPREALARAAALLAFAPDRGRARVWAAEALMAASDHPADVEQALLDIRAVGA